MDDVTLTLRAQDQATAVLKSINAQLARMRTLTMDANRGFQASSRGAARTAMNSELAAQREYLRVEQRRIRLVAQRSREEQRSAQVRARAEIAATRAAEREQQRAARAAQRAQELHRRQWSGAAFLSGMRGTQGISRQISQMFGGGQSGLAAYGSIAGTGLNMLVQSVMKFWQVVGGVLWSVVQKVFHFLVNVVQDLIQKFLRMATVVGTAVVAAFSAMAYSAVNAASSIQQMSIGLDTLVGKGEKAKRFMQEMMEFARKTPFDFFQMMPDTRRLLGVGFNTEEVKSLMQSMGDSAAALGIGQAGITGLVKAFSDVRAKGYVQAQEITRQFAEWGVPALRFISEYLGVSQAVTLQLIQQRKITAEIGIAAIQGGMARNFGGAMERAFRTVQGQLNTLKETWGFTMAAIGEASLKPIEGIIAGISGMLNAFRTGGGAEKLGKWLASWLTPQRIHNFVQSAIKAIAILARGVSWLYTQITGFMDSVLSGDIYSNIANRIMAIGEYLGTVLEWAIGKIPTLLSAALQSMAGITGRFLLAEVAALGVGVMSVIGYLIGGITRTIGGMLDYLVNTAIEGVNKLPGVEIAWRSKSGDASWNLMEGGIQEAWRRWSNATVMQGQNGVANTASIFRKATSGMMNDFPGMPDWSRPQSAVWQGRANNLANWGRKNIGGMWNGAIPPWLQQGGGMFEKSMMDYLNTPLKDINNNTAAALGVLNSIDDSLKPDGFGSNKQVELLRNRLARTNLGGGGVSIHITGGTKRDQEVAEQAIRQYVNQTNPFSAGPAGTYVGAQ